LGKMEKGRRARRNRAVAEAAKKFGVHPESVCRLLAGKRFQSSGQVDLSPSRSAKCARWLERVSYLRQLLTQAVFDRQRAAG
jgi:hypothetical protein